MRLAAWWRPWRGNWIGPSSFPKSSVSGTVGRAEYRLAFPGLVHLALWRRAEYLCLEIFQTVASAFSRVELRYGKGRASLWVTRQVSCKQPLELNACLPARSYSPCPALRTPFRAVTVQYNVRAGARLSFAYPNGTWHRKSVLVSNSDDGVTQALG